MDMQLLYWHWLGLGFVLMLVELLVPGFFFMWLGVSAIAVGMLTLLIPDLSFVIQGATFALMGIVSFYLSRRYFRAAQAKFGESTVNKRGAQMIGQIVVVDSAITNGHGKVTVGDGVWSARGADAAVGARVKITGIDGTILLVEAV